MNIKKLGLILPLLLSLNACGSSSDFHATGKLVINPQFEIAMPFTEGLAAVQMNGRFGYIDQKGSFVIKPRFTEWSPFQDGVALVSDTPAEEKFDSQNLYNGTKFLINTSGEVVKRFPKGVIVEWSNVYDSDQDTVRYVKYDKSWNCLYLDRNGEPLFQVKFKTCGQFSGGLSAATEIKSGLMGYIDTKGKWSIPPKFKDANAFVDGLASVSIASDVSQETSGYINETGKWEINPQFYIAYSFSNGIARIIECDGCDSDEPNSYGAHGFINKSGEYIFETKFPSYNSKFNGDQDYVEGYAVEYFRDGWTFIDIYGDPISELRLQNAGQFRNGYAPIELNNKWGYMDSHGLIAIKPQFEDAANFFEGMAAVKIAGKWGYIN